MATGMVRERGCGGGGGEQHQHGSCGNVLIYWTITIYLSTGRYLLSFRNANVMKIFSTSSTPTPPKHWHPQEFTRNTRHWLGLECEVEALRT